MRAIDAWQDRPDIATPEDHAALANLERQAGVSLSPQLPRARCAVMFARLVAGGYWRDALSASGLSWQHIGIMQAGDPGGFGALAKAAEEAKDAIFRRDGRDALRERAIEGVPEPVYQRGELVGVRRKYSDRLLEFGLSKLDKPTFGDDRRAVAQTAGVIYNIGVAIGDDAVPERARTEKVIESGTSAAQNRIVKLPQDV